MLSASKKTLVALAAIVAIAGGAIATIAHADMAAAATGCRLTVTRGPAYGVPNGDLVSTRVINSTQVACGTITVSIYGRPGNQFIGLETPASGTLVCSAPAAPGDPVICTGPFAKTHSETIRTTWGPPAVGSVSPVSPYACLDDGDTRCWSAW